MKILVTGAKGQLGYDVMHALDGRRHEAIGVGREMMELTDARAVDTVITQIKPDAVIHCAAWTAVDAAEDAPEKCHLVNAYGTEIIAKACRTIDCKMLYISTDYVFSGEGSRPWEPEDGKMPLNIYGKTKYEGELAVQRYLEKYYIVRTGWIFGINGKNFVKTMLKLGREKNDIRVVNDQIGSPTYTKDLADLLSDMIESEKYGVYHATNEGYCSWYDFACEIFKIADLNIRVTPQRSEDYITKAKRPKNSRMSKAKLVLNGFSLLPDWQDALCRFMNELGDEIG